LLAAGDTVFGAVYEKDEANIYKYPIHYEISYREKSGGTGFLMSA